MVFKLVRTDVEGASKIELVVGSHRFGRGVFLDCDDKRVSRSHGQLEVTEDVVKLHALHHNPCFYKTKESEDTNILKQGEDIDLCDGDHFGLLPNNYWYKLIHFTSPINSPTTNEVNESTEELSAINVTPKKESAKEVQESNDDLENFNVNDTISAQISDSPSLITNMNIKDEPQSPTQNYHVANEDSPSKRPLDTNDSNDLDGKRIKTEPVQQASPDVSIAGPSNADTKPKIEPPASPVKPAQPPPPTGKERCFYGAKCYRRNPQHLMDFAHPGTPEWGSGDMGVCPYGAGCMKRDTRHWNTHSHPPGTSAPGANNGPHRHAPPPGMRMVERRGNIYYINAHTVNFYDDHFQAEDSDGDSVDYDYEF